MWLNFNIAIYTVLLSAIDGYILLFPVQHYILTHIQHGG